jgi:hypothetical protein
MDERLPDLLGCTADDSLLDAGPDTLPADIGRPEPVPRSTARARLVGVGVALTGVTLLGGVALVALSAVELISGSVALAIGALVLGLVLAGTHWGWVHVAEATADALEGRQRRKLLAHRERWLRAIEPYARYEVSTGVAPDGSIEIVRACYSPVRCANDRFRFERAIERRELQEAERASAAVVERAEQLRNEAALDTERERRRYEELRDAHRAAALAGTDERDRLAALRAASEALSERINANLREPPVQG